MLSDEEIEARTEVTLKAANVTQQSTAEVSEQLTAVWNGYRVSAEEAEMYVDKLSAVAAATASDLEELSAGMSRVASAANLMGVDVDQLNAQLSTIISVTRQAPESVGTALKSIYARMSDIQSGLDEETSLSSYTAEMEKYGINVLDANKELRDMGEVIEEVGNKWKDMSAEQQIGLAQAMAGTRQYVNLTALFENWDRYNYALDISKNSLGALQQQQDIYMEGVQSSLKVLRATQEDLYSSLIKPEDIKGVVDIFIKLTEAATLFIDTLGGGKNTLLGLGSIATQVFNRQISSSIATAIANFKAMKGNAKQVTAELEIIKDFEGIAINDKALGTLIEMKKQMIDYSGVMSEEQQNQANSIIKTTNEIYNQIDAWEEQKKIAGDLYQRAYGENIDYDSSTATEYIKDLQEIVDEYKTIENEEKTFLSILDRASGIDRNLKSGKEESLRINQEYTETESMLKATLEESSRTISELKTIRDSNKRSSEEYKNAVVALRAEEEKYKSTKESLNKLNSEYLPKIEERAKSEEQLEKQLDRVNERMEDYIYNIRMLIGEEDDLSKSGRLNRDSLEKLEKAYKEFERVKSESTSKGVNLDNLLIDDATVKDRFKKLISTYKEVTSDLTEETRKAISIITKEIEQGESTKLSNTLEINQSNFNEDIKNIDLQKTIMQYTQLASTIGQVAFAYTSFVNVLKIWNDENASVDEKITQSIIFLTTTIPALTTAIGQLNEKFGTTNLITGIFTQLKNKENFVIEKSIALTTTEGIVKKVSNNQVLSLVAAMQKELIARKLSANEIDKTILKETLLTATKKKGIVLNKAQTAAILRRIAVRETENETISIGMALQKAWNASLLSTPIGMFTAAVAALTIAFVALNKATEKAREETIEHGRASQEAAVALIQEQQNVKSLYESYSKSYSTYKKTGEEKEELRKTTEELCKALDVELSTLDLLSENYDKINKKIAKERYNKAEEVKFDLESDLTDVFNAFSTEFGETSKYGLDLSNLRIESGLFLSEGDKQLSEKIKEYLKEYDFDADIYGAGDYRLNSEDVTTDFLIENIKTSEDFVEISKALREVYKSIQKDFEESPGILRGSKLYKSFSKIIDETSGSLQKISEIEKGIQDQNFTLIEGELSKRNISLFDVDSLEDYKKYKEEFIKAFNEINEEEILDIDIENYFKTLNSEISTFIDQLNIDEELREKFSKTNTSEEIENFINKLQENNQLELAATIDYDSIKTIEEATREIRKKVLEDSQKEAAELQNLIDSLSKDKKTKSELKEESELVTELESKYTKLGKIQDVNSREYIKALIEIRELEERDNAEYLKIQRQEQEETLDQAIDNLKKLEKQYKDKGINPLSSSKFKEAMKEVEDSLRELTETEYQIDLQIGADIRTDVKDAFGLANELDDLRAVINDDLTYSLEEALSLIEQGYGAIFRESEVLAQEMDDTSQTMIKLNEESLNSFIDSKQAELEADRQSKIAQLEMQKTLIQAQINALDSELEAVGEALSAENDMDAATAVAKMMNSEKEYQAATEALNKELTSEEEAATEIQNIDKTLFDALGGMYDQNSMNYQQAEIDATNAQAREINTRIENVKLLGAAYSNLGSVIQAAMEGQSIDMGSPGTASGGGSASVTGFKGVDLVGITAKKVQADYTQQYTKDLFNQNRELFDATLEAKKSQLLARKADAERRLGEADAGITALESANLTLDRKQAGASKKSGGGSGGKGGSEKDPELLDYLEDEKDRYHDINLELEELETNLNRLQKQQDKLYGEDLIENLNEQLNIIKNQVHDTERKLEIAKQEKQEIKDSLASYGVTFNPDPDNDYINNYEAIMQAKLDYVNQLIDQYNAMSAEEQENNKEIIEQAKDDYKELQSLIDKYDDLTSDFIPELEDNLQDQLNEQIEINIKKFTMEVDIRLDMAEMEREYNEFERKVIDGIKDDDILGNAKANLKDFLSYYDTYEVGTGPIEKLTDQINETMEQIDQIDEDGFSDVYGDNKAKAMEDLKKYYQEMIQQLEDVVDLIDEIKQSYLDMIDEAVDAFDKQVDQYDYINDLLNHDMNVIGLVYGDKAYSQMAKYYDQIEQNNNKELDFLRQRVAYAQEMMDKETNPEAREKWEEEWKNALEELNDKVEDSLQNIIDKYSNAVKKTFDELNKKITSGLGLDYVSDEWDLMNKNADQYLDTINALYGMQELENKYLDAIDQTDNLSSQQKLNDMMNSQLDMLRDKDKLTQYDVDRANMMYELTLKQIALEEAQQNKSKMRLRRDSQGNYSYQYVADDGAIEQAQNDVLAIQNDLYNFDKERYKENLNELYEYYVEFQEKYTEIMLDMSLTDEERQERAKLLQEQYGQLINGIVEQNETIKKNLYESTFMAFEGLYAADAESFKAMTDLNIDSFRNLTEAEKDLIIEELIPQWDSGVQHMADVFAGEGGFIPTCRDAFTELDETTKDYQDSLNDLERSAGINFEAIGEGYDNTIAKAEELLESNEELIDSYRRQIDAVLDVIDELDGLIDQYKDVQEAAEDATRATYEFIQAQQQAAADSVYDDEELIDDRDYSGATSPLPAPNWGNSNGSSSSGGSGGSGGGSGGGSSSKPKQPKYYTYKLKISDRVYYNAVSDGQGGVQFRNPSTATLTSLKPNGSSIKTTSKRDPEGETYYIWNWGDSKGYSYRRPSELDWVAKYDTGGYTGDWGNKDGKIGVLHEKELILNKKDTERILAAVTLVRDMSTLLDNLNSNLNSRIAGMLSNFTIPMNNIVSLESPNDTLEQNVHIEASFPNVQKSSEIENAINNLVNIASMRAYGNKR